jgi:hypothetical protein
MIKTTNQIFAIALLLSAAGCLEETAIAPNISRDGTEVQENQVSKYQISAKSFLMIAKPSPERLIEIQLVSDGPATFTVDWGTGKETYEQTPLTHFTYLNLAFWDPIEYNITVTGDIDRVIGLYNNSREYLGATALNVRRLSNLKTLFMDHLDFQHLDLSKNRNISSVSVSNNPNLASIDLPSRHTIREFNLDGDINLPVEQLNAIIESIYNNALKNNITGGTFRFNEAGTSQGNEMLGPPSQESLNRLRLLRDNYSWTILPNPD